MGMKLSPGRGRSLDRGALAVLLASRGLSKVCNQQELTVQHREQHLMKKKLKENMCVCVGARGEDSQMTQ